MKPVLLLLAGLVLLAGVSPLPGLRWPSPAPRPPVVAPGPATAAVYVYEKDAGGVPPGVTVGLDKLNRERRIVASLLEADATNGAGEVPAQFREAVAAARGRGLPALVVLSGSAVAAVVPAPTTAEQIVGAVP